MFKFFLTYLYFLFFEFELTLMAVENLLSSNSQNISNRLDITISGIDEYHPVMSFESGLETFACYIILIK